MSRNRSTEHENYREMYETPLYEVFAPLEMEFQFSWDLAANEKNALCELWLGPGSKYGENSLSVDWSELGGSLWLNPPYGRGISEWVKKAYESSALGSLIVALLPSNTDAKWFHDWVLGRSEIRWIRGRVQFLIDGKRPLNPNTGKPSGNTGGNFIAVYRPFGRSF